MKGVIWVALGARAEAEAARSTKGLLKHNRYLPTKVLTKINFHLPEGIATKDQQAHWAKVCADLWTPYSQTLLLDADTRVKGDVSVGFQMLNKGWELVLVPSLPPKPGEVFWHLSGEEREHTLEQLGTWQHTMFNTGVLYFNNTERVHRLFECWRNEWLRFKDRDQGAFLRCLRRCPVHLWLLGYPYNSLRGEVVTHLFGRAR